MCLATQILKRHIIIHLILKRQQIVTLFSEYIRSHHHPYYVTSSSILCHIIIHLILKRQQIVTLFSENTGAQTFENDAPAAILGHIIIHTMSHHHTFGAQTFENNVPAARVRSICNARGRRKGGLSHQALSRT
jgi:hypothetical protein